MGSVAFYIGSLKKGGAERVFVNLATYFLEQGCNVTMVTQYKKENEYELPAGIRRVISDLTPEEEGGRIVNLFRRYKKLRRIFREIHADVVLSTEEYPTKGMRLLAKTLFYAADGIVMQTADAVRFFQPSLQKKCVILKNSLNPAFVRPRYEDDRPQDIVAVGRMDENKNQRMAIRAFCKIAERFPDARLILYGDGPLRRELTEEVRSLDMSERILLPGRITDVPEKLEKAYAFVLTSFTEGMPNTLIEAMSLGTACISTDCPCGGPKDLIRDGENGFLVPVDDSDALADRLTRLLENPDLMQQMGKNAAKLQAEYLPEKVNQEWADYFQKVAGKKKLV